jgi:hypothetical protein
VRLDVRTRPLASRAGVGRVHCTRPHVLPMQSRTSSSIARTRIHRRIRCSVRAANDPSHQAPPLRSFAARSRSCIARSLGAMFRYRPEPSRPGRMS